MSEFDNEREMEIVRGDAEMVRRESARRTRRSFLVGGIAAAAGYAAWRAVDQSAQVARLQSALRNVIDWNAAASRAVFRERGLSPTYPLSRAVPLRMNGVIGMEQMLVPESWRLQVTGVRDAQRSRFYCARCNGLGVRVYRCVGNGCDAGFEEWSRGRGAECRCAACADARARAESFRADSDGEWAAAC